MEFNFRPWEGKRVNEGGDQGRIGRQGKGKRGVRGDGTIFVDMVSNGVDVNKLRVTYLT